MEILKEAINKIKKSINSFFGHAKEFFKAFSEPAEQELPLELAIEEAADMTPEEKAALMGTTNGLDYELDNGENEPKKGRKKSDVNTQKEPKIQPEPTRRRIENNLGMDRD